MHLKRICFWGIIAAFVVSGMNSCSQDEAHSVDPVNEQDPDNPQKPDEPQGLKCGNNQVICDGVCVHLEDDVDHCGACGNKCADSLGDGAAEWICHKNACVAQACKAHYHLQDGACVEDDVYHCAGTDCTSLPGWDSGYCDKIGQCVAEACLDGYQLNHDDIPFCEEYVQDCDGDASVCELREGATEMACVEGKCAISKCDTDHYHWNEEQTLCVENSIHECGATFVDCTNYGGWNPEDENNRCDLNEDGVVSCIAASCLPDYHVYYGPNAPCEPDDHENCGEHEHACEENQVCLDGVCTIECADGLKDCDGTCVDLASSLQHCGSCGAACTADVFEGAGELACENSACKVKSCKGGYHLYDGKCEKDTESDCGSHGTVCASHLKCVNGKCGCSSGTDCGSSCVNTANDKNNCGACGNVCKSHLVCSGSKCGCSSGTDCGSTCVDLQSDNNNCGSCGNKCASNKKCSNGSCVCNSGTACGSSCVDLKTDNSNCGSCGNKCPSDRSCQAGSCQCSNGYQNCNGICINVYGSDSNNCGACNHSCYYVNASFGCAGGSCWHSCYNDYIDQGWGCEYAPTPTCPAGNTGIDCQQCADGYTYCGTSGGYPLCLKMGGVIPATYCQDYCNHSPGWGGHWTNGQGDYYITRCNSGQTCYMASWKIGEKVQCL